MVMALTHRGPDDLGVERLSDGRLALGSSRLAIIDLSPAGHMPMSNESGDVWVTFNGEIYNHRELRRMLLGHGHRFKSSSDTEVLVHLYEEMGWRALREIEGMFAVALWDGRNETLLLARDRFGEKPLYWTVRDETLSFASEIKALLVDSLQPRHINLAALNQYLTFGFTLPPRTILSGIKKLGPSEMLSVVRGRLNGPTPYLSPMEFSEPTTHNRLEQLQELRSRLERAIESCMIADVPVGAFLSGGVDSSAVVSIMARLSGRTVEAVNVSYDGHAGTDESEFASAVSKRVGARLHRVVISDAECEEALAECVFQMDEPVADPACLSSYFGAQRFRELGVPVALVGEGADEFFLGYPYYRRHSRLAAVWRLRDAIPRPVRVATQFPVQAMLGPLGLAVHRDLVRRAAEGESLFVSSEPFFLDIDKRRLLGGELARVALREGPASTQTDRIRAELNGRHGQDVLAQMGYAEVRMRMAEKLLMRVDKQSMAHSIETRAPFLHPEVAHFALSLSGDDRVPRGEPKGLLKEAVRDLVPPAVLRRKKMGFTTPTKSWFTSFLGDRVQERAAQSRLFRDGLLSYAELQRLSKEHRSGHQLHHTRLWNLLSLLEWEVAYRPSDFSLEE